MGQAVFSNNTTIKVKGKVSAGYTVAAGEYVEASYSPVVGSGFAFGAFTVRYPPGDSVQSSFVTSGVTQGLITAVCFVNTP